MSLPSIRECEQRLQALERAPAPVAELAQALAVARALLRHLRDFGTPPAQEQTLKQRAQSLSPVTRGTPMHLARPAGPPLPRAAALVDPAAAPAAPARHERPQPAPSRGLGKKGPPDSMTGTLVLKHFARDHAWLYRMIQVRGFPKPIAVIGRMRYFARADVLRWERENPEASKPTGNFRTDADPGPQPEGTETIEQLCARIERTPPWFKWVQSNAKSSAEKPPEPIGRWGRHRLYSRAEMDAWLARRAALMAARGTARFVNKSPKEATE